MDFWVTGKSAISVLQMKSLYAVVSPRQRKDCT